MVNSEFQNIYIPFHSKKESIRSILRRESLQRKRYWFRKFWNFVKLTFSTKWFYLPKNSTRIEIILYYKIILLNDESTRWLYK
jgi:hypothetical protein